MVMNSSQVLGFSRLENVEYHCLACFQSFKPTQRSFLLFSQLSACAAASYTSSQSSGFSFPENDSKCLKIVIIYDFFNLNFLKNILNFYQEANYTIFLIFLPL